MNDEAGIRIKLLKVLTLTLLRELEYTESAHANSAHRFEQHVRTFANDRPHQFKFNGSYRTPWRLMISGNFYAQSGTPFSQLVPHPVYGNNQGFGLPRGTAIVPAVTTVEPGFPNRVESVGSNRTPRTMNLDLGFYYPVKLGEKREIRLSADWFNVFNSQRATTLDQTFTINSGVAGVPPVSNPFYGSAQIVQAPSAWRLGAKFSF